MMREMEDQVRDGQASMQPAPAAAAAADMQHAPAASAAGMQHAPAGMQHAPAPAAGMQYVPAAAAATGMQHASAAAKTGMPAVPVKREIGARPRMVRPQDSPWRPAVPMAGQPAVQPAAGVQPAEQNSHLLPIPPPPSDTWRLEHEGRHYQSVLQDSRRSCPQTLAEGALSLAMRMHAAHTAHNAQIQRWVATMASQLIPRPPTQAAVVEMGAAAAGLQLLPAKQEEQDKLLSTCLLLSPAYVCACIYECMCAYQGMPYMLHVRVPMCSTTNHAHLRGQVRAACTMHKCKQHTQMLCIRIQATGTYVLCTCARNMHTCFVSKYKQHTHIFGVHVQTACTLELTNQKTRYIVHANIRLCATSQLNAQL